jgi:hypothetical protein
MKKGDRVNAQSVDKKPGANKKKGKARKGKPDGIGLKELRRVVKI